MMIMNDNDNTRMEVIKFATSLFFSIENNIQYQSNVANRDIWTSEWMSECIYLHMCSAAFTYRPVFHLKAPPANQHTDPQSSNWNNTSCRWRWGSSHHCGSLIMCHLSLIAECELGCVCECEWVVCATITFTVRRLVILLFHASCGNTLTHQSDRTERPESRKGLLIGTEQVQPVLEPAHTRACASATKCLFGPGVIAELLRRKYFGSALDPSQSAMSSSQIRHMMHFIGPAYAPSGELNIWTSCPSTS